MTEVMLRCACGAFGAVLHRAGTRHGNRCVCYCTDCQNFAAYLGREEEMLDAHGGTDIYQASPGRLEILQGREHLACVHLTDKPTLRWFTNCCRSPVGNTLNSNRLPFIGVIASAIDTSAIPGGLDELIGPIRARVNGAGAKGEVGELGIHQSAPLSLYWRFGRMVLAAKFSGEYRKSPLFDPESGRPIVKPIRQQQ